MRKLIGTLIILSGIIVLLYPKLSDYFLKNIQNDLLIEYENAMGVLSEKNDQIIQEVTIVIDLSETGDDLKSVETRVDFNEVPDFEPKFKTSEKTYTREERNAYITSAWPVEAVLKIDKIDLKMPVIEGAQVDYLDVSICSLKGMGKPWTSGNYAIAGHRSLTYGRHFSRLDELVVGDILSVETLNEEIYVYNVYDILIVHETDLSVLEHKAFDEVTLITCDPIGEKNPEYRLIVKAKKTNPS